MLPVFLRATGAAISGSALLLAGLSAPAVAQSRIPTTWTLVGEQEFKYFVLTESGSSAEISDVSGTVTMRHVFGPRFTRFLDLVGLTFPPLVLEHEEGPITAHSLQNPYTPFGVSYFRTFADGFGDYGEHGWDVRYDGDEKYAPSETLADRIVIEPPAHKAVPTSTLSYAPDGQMTVSLDPEINGTGELSCMPLADVDFVPYDEYVPPPTIPVTDGTAAAYCDTNGSDATHVMLFRVHSSDTNTAHVNLMLFAPTEATTTDGIDANDAFAPGQVVEVSAAGLDPGSEYQVVLESTPVVVGHLYTNASGIGSTNVTLPVNLTDGIHHLILRKDGSDTVRSELKVSAMADPSASTSVSLVPSDPGDPGDPSDPGAPGEPKGGAGSLTGSLGS